MRPSAAVACVLLLGLVGCGESASQKDARQQREDRRAISTLSDSMRRAAEAGAAEHRAELARRRAVERLHVLERETP